LPPPTLQNAPAREKIMFLTSSCIYRSFQNKDNRCCCV